MKKILLATLALVASSIAYKANALDINAKDAQAIMNTTTMTLKRVHSGGKDYLFNFKWDSATNSWKNVNFVQDFGYGWRPEPRMPLGTYWAGSAVSGTSLYVIGGSDHWNNIATYNFSTNSWSDAVVEHFGFLLRAAAVNGKIYIFDSSGPSGPAWVYNIANKSVSKLSVTPPNLEWTSEPAVYNGNVYFFGGYGPLNTTWEFNPSTLKFTRKANMPSAGYGASTAVLNGKIYVIGGNYRTNKIEVYNPGTNTWAASLSFSSLKLYGWETAGTLGNKIAITGQGGETFIFNPATNKLSTQSNLTTPHGSYLTGEQLGGRLYVAGGEWGWNQLDSFKIDPLIPSSISETSFLTKSELSRILEPDHKAIEIDHRDLVNKFREINTNPDDYDFR